ncbi:unnamed protein product [Rhodiola kirilowii]
MCRAPARLHLLLRRSEEALHRRNRCIFRRHRSRSSPLNLLKRRNRQSFTRSSSYPITSPPAAYLLCGSVRNPKLLKSQFLISFFDKDTV